MAPSVLKKTGTKLIICGSLFSFVFLFQNCARMGGFQNLSGPRVFPSIGLSQSKFTCDPKVPLGASNLPRLTKRQFVNTLVDLVAAGVASNDQVNLNNFIKSAEFNSAIASFPHEGIQGKGNAMIYDTADQRLSSAMLRAQLGLTLMTAQFISSDSTRLNSFVRYYSGGACSSETVGNNSATKNCYDAFINGFGLRALRRPVERVNSPTDSSNADPAAQNDLAFYGRIFSDTSEGGFDSLITTMLLSPDSLFMASFKGDSGDDRQVLLTNYEVAAKLSYYFTDSAPDATLLAAASSGFAGPGNTIAEQSERLYNSPRTRDRFRNFFLQWIRPEAIPALIATGNSPQTDLAALRENAIQEMLDLTEYYTFGKPDGKLADIITSNISFAKTPDLAGLYGVPAWPGKNADGSFNEQALPKFDTNNPRAGFFTRAGYAFSGARDTNLIIRGARLRKDYLCYDFTPPAAFTLSGDIPLEGPPTVRNLVIANTRGSNCASCHQTLINPIGFALENYDSFGRYRKMEQIFDADNKVSQTVPVDAHAMPQIGMTDTSSVEDGVGFSQVLGKSPEFNACFVRHYFRYAQSRLENLKSDGCALQEMMTSVSNPTSGSLKGMIKNLAQSSTFKKRQINP